MSASVPDAKQGEAQGAINGVRALTEGFGPLCFGMLMNFFEVTSLKKVVVVVVDDDERRQGSLP